MECDAEVPVISGKRQEMNSELTPRTPTIKIMLVNRYIVCTSLDSPTFTVVDNHEFAILSHHLASSLYSYHTSLVRVPDLSIHSHNVYKRSLHLLQDSQG
jgi:hypothetical protein